MTPRPPLRHAGLVLAAGASSRMGRPKALLPFPDGVPLAARQAALLREAGCERVAVILGCDAAAIASRLPSCEIVVNRAWELGRLTSLQAGLRAAPGFDGYLVLPVDTAGVRAATLAALLREAELRRPRALRPCHGHAPGRVLWLGAALAAELARQPAQDARLDEQVRDLAERWDVEDPAILSNVNTPEAWAAFLASGTD